MALAAGFVLPGIARAIVDLKHGPTSLLDIKTSLQDALAPLSCLMALVAYLLVKRWLIPSPTFGLEQALPLDPDFEKKLEPLAIHDLFARWIGGLLFFFMWFEGPESTGPDAFAAALTMAAAGVLIVQLSVSLLLLFYHVGQRKALQAMLARWQDQREAKKRALIEAHIRKRNQKWDFYPHPPSEAEAANSALPAEDGKEDSPPNRPA